MVLRTSFRLVWLCLALLWGPAAHAVTVTDARGEHTFKQSPERVVSLSWAMTENVLALGVEPVGVADIEGYNTWVVRPAMPVGVDDVGQRSEPSIEELAALKPDVIILSNGQEGLADKLEQIAPVLFFDAYSASHDNAAAARRIFLEMARLFDRVPLARQKLAAMDDHIAVQRERLHGHFGEQLPTVTGVRFTNNAVVLVYGDNSMPQHALHKLGIRAALDQPPNQWGIVQKKLVDLSRIDEGALLYFKPAPGIERLFDSPLWQAMPVVRAGRVAAVESTWSYGGALSIGYLAEAMTDALLTLDPQ